MILADIFGIGDAIKWGEIIAGVMGALWFFLTHIGFGLILGGIAIIWGVQRGLLKAGEKLAAVPWLAFIIDGVPTLVAALMILGGAAWVGWDGYHAHRVTDTPSRLEQRQPQGAIQDLHQGQKPEQVMP